MAVMDNLSRVCLNKRGARRAVGGPLVLLFCLAVTGGCAVTPDAEPYDPYESTNRRFFAFNNTLDRYVLAPVSDAYVAVTPELIRKFVFNFFDNLTYPLVIANDLLQAKFEQGMEDAGRFVFNSTLGLGGILDISSGVGLERHVEDFGQTMAVWGVPPGPYLELPLLGPNTVRTTPDIVARRAANPLTYADILVSVPTGAVNVVDTRARLDPAIKARDESSIDPYVFQREAYLQRRRHLIYDGNPPLDEDDFDVFEEDEVFEEGEEKTE